VLLDDLKKFNKEQVAKAGARYTPGIDQSAPNLPIHGLLSALDALGCAANFRNALEEVIAPLRKLKGAEARVAGELHKAMSFKLTKYVNLLESIREAKPTGPEINLKKAQVRTAELLSVLMTIRDRASQHASSLRPDDPYERNAEYDTAYSVARSVRELSERYERVDTALQSAAMLARYSRALFVGGPWGTGKTHLLCDYTLARDGEDKPTLLALAHHIPPHMNPLDGLAQVTEFAKTGRELLKKLSALGKQYGNRALLIIDAINEGDRESWKRYITAVEQDTRTMPWLGIVLSCRKPFEQQIAPDGIPSRFVEVLHAGFEGIELEAQEAYFRYNSIPFPEVPLLSEEFSRPLTLKIICEAFKDLARETIKKRFEGIASGQRSMTYVLEHFIKRRGGEIGAQIGMNSEFFWYLLKGSKKTRSGYETGMAIEMASRGMDYLTKVKALEIIEDHLPSESQIDPQFVLQHCAANGILVEDFAWPPGAQQGEEIVRLPYQRFSDHLIARHLLQQLKSCSTVDAIKNAFLPGTPLGRIFETHGFGGSYENPGVAEAIVAEFPERVRRVCPEDKRELVFHLPKAAANPRLMKDPFLGSLFWRSPASFSRQTDAVVSHFLNEDRWTQREFFEALMTLGTKERHPYGADRLWRYLQRAKLPDRDERWSEYLRHLDATSAPLKICTWVERNAANITSKNTAARLIVLASLMLTTTDRELRDRATHTLVILGKRFPSELTAHAKMAFGINDPYVTERMVAACFGALMSEQTRITPALQESAQDFAEFLYRNVFAPNAEHATHHALVREFALGFITLAEWAANFAAKPSWRRHLSKPFAQIPPPFPKPQNIRKAAVAEGRAAIHMDFGNYTIGHLIPDRRNYDDKNPDYAVQLKQIAWRINKLGYTREKFEKLDREIAQSQPHTRGDHEGRVDRYGKKYGWIAYFEAYGYRSANNTLSKYREDRPSEIGIDPTFHGGPVPWNFPPILEFSAATKGQIKWLKDGPTPDARPVLLRQEVADLPGPWVLLDGFLIQKNPPDGREAFTFCRGLLVAQDKISELKSRFFDVEYPGNHEIPESGKDHYTFVGEVPWSSQFAKSLRGEQGSFQAQTEEVFGRWMPTTERVKIKAALKDLLHIASREDIAVMLDVGIEKYKVAQKQGKKTIPPELANLLKCMEIANTGKKESDRIDLSDLRTLPNQLELARGYVEVTGSQRIPGIEAELPSYSLEFEGNRIMRNRGPMEVPAPKICVDLGLRYGGRESGIVDAEGRTASIAVRSPEGGIDSCNGLYLRLNLLMSYLAQRGLVMVWLNWGERECRDDDDEYGEKARQDLEIQSIWQKRQNIHRRLIMLNGADQLVDLTTDAEKSEQSRA